ncbi:MAG: cyclic nucleotide-binding domain-containing protein [Xanthobacteraceae bacterium]|nr:cyclic nucleotide-binding domain-containing protein [Xanthobacteraceae bacterium]
MPYEPVISPISVQATRKELSRKVYPAGATIFAEGEAGTAAYVLLHGDVTIYIAFGAEHQRRVTDLKPGEMFGVHALMAGSQRGATALTEHGCEVLAVSETKLREKLDAVDPFVRYWVEYLSKRVIDLSAK